MWERVERLLIFITLENINQAISLFCLRVQATGVNMESWGYSTHENSLDKTDSQRWNMTARRSYIRSVDAEEKSTTT